MVTRGVRTQHSVESWKDASVTGGVSRLSAVWGPGRDPGQKKGASGKSGEAGVRLEPGRRPCMRRAWLPANRTVPTYVVQVNSLYYSCFSPTFL